MADANQITPAQFFEQIVPAGFEADAAGNPPQDDATVQYVVTGEGGGEWALQIAGGKLNVVKGKVDSPLVTYTVSAADLIDAVNGANGAAPTLIIPPRRQGRPGAGAAVKALRGTMALNLTRPQGGEPFKLEMCFNGAAAPRTTMTMAISDYVAMGEGKLNGQEAFMTGKMRVEGDMGFLMQVGMATAS
ncbi:MAG: SCP2 sterol-binding domain-containing protein [Thermodesulfobacteriota bacterium]